MKNKLFTLAAAMMLAAVIGGVYSAPALAAVIKAALVKNVDEPGRSPFSGRIVVTCGGSGCAGESIAVPNDRRLVVESVTGTARTEAISEIIKVSLRVNGNLANAAYIPMELQATNASYRFYACSRALRVFFAAGEQPQIQVETEGVLADAEFFVTGYLVDVTI